MSQEKCQAKNPAICRIHGWISKPLTSEEARNALLEAHSKVNSSRKDTDLDKALLDYYGTPDGKREAKALIKKFKALGKPTIVLTEKLNQATYLRLQEEAKFEADLFVENKSLNEKSLKKLFKNHLDVLEISSPTEGEILVKDKESNLKFYEQSPDGKSSSEFTHLVLNKPYDKTLTGEAKQAADLRALADYSVALTKYQAGELYNKPATGKILAEIRTYGLRKAPSKKPESFIISGRKGQKLAEVTFKGDDKFESASVPLSRQDVKHFFDATEFRSWLFNNRERSDLTLPDYY